MPLSPLPPLPPLQPTGCRSKYSATTPDTCGVAMDVPVLAWMALSDALTALTTFTPGA